MKVSCYVRNLIRQIYFRSHGNDCFIRGVYFCMGAYKHDVVVVVEMGAYIYGMLIFHGCLLYDICAATYKYFVVLKSS